MIEKDLETFPTELMIFELSNTKMETTSHTDYDLIEKFLFFFPVFRRRLILILLMLWGTYRQFKFLTLFAIVFHNILSTNVQPILSCLFPSIIFVCPRFPRRRQAFVVSTLKPCTNYSNLCKILAKFNRGKKENLLIPTSNFEDLFECLLL